MFNGSEQPVQRYVFVVPMHIIHACILSNLNMYEEQKKWIFHMNIIFFIYYIYVTNKSLIACQSDHKSMYHGLKLCGVQPVHQTHLPTKMRRWRFRSFWRHLLQDTGRHSMAGNCGWKCGSRCKLFFEMSQERITWTSIATILSTVLEWTIRQPCTSNPA